MPNIFEGKDIRNLAFLVTLLVYTSRDYSYIYNCKNYLTQISGVT